MALNKLPLGIASATAAGMLVQFIWEKWVAAPDSIAQAVSQLARPENPLGWNLLSAVLIAVLTTLLFHSLAIPGSRMQRGIYVGLTAGLLAAGLSSTIWLAKMGGFSELVWPEFPKTVFMGLVAGVIYSLFHLKQKIEP